jgi:hypothetical protein
MPKDLLTPAETLREVSALNVPSKQHFEAHSAVCFATGMAILI